MTSPDNPADIIAKLELEYLHNVLSANGPEMAEATLDDIMDNLRESLAREPDVRDRRRPHPICRLTG